MYSTQQISLDGYEGVELSDSETQMCVKTLHRLGNNIVEFSKGGFNHLWVPKDFRSLVGSRNLFGMPLMAPWVNRLASDSYSIQERTFHLNPSLDSLLVRDENNHPLHGLLLYSPRWEVVELGATSTEAFSHSRLLFGSYPDYLSHFPFSFDIDVVTKLTNGSLVIQTIVTNQSEFDLPINLGYHPYFRLPGNFRQEWELTFPAKEEWELNSVNLPTGNRNPLHQSYSLRLGEKKVDNLYGLDQSVLCPSRVSLSDGRTELSIEVGPKYPYLMVFAPLHYDYVCIEPMTAPVNAFELEKEVRNLHFITPGKKWAETLVISVRSV